MSRRGKPFGGAHPAFGQARAAAEGPAKQLTAVLNQARKSGQLNLANRDLEEVPAAVWRINIDLPEEAKTVDLDRADQSWWEQTNLTKLFLSSNKLRQLSDDIRQLEALTVVDVHDNQLESLPDAIGDLGQLSRLVLNDNRLTRLPSSLCRLAQLHFLSADANQLTELPPTINLLQALTVLKLDKNKLTRLPDGVCQLKLCSLSVSNNRLTELPAGVGQMAELKELIAFGNQLTTTPSFENCKSLKRLELHRNRLNQLPTVGPSVQELLLRDNSIREIDSTWRADGLTNLELGSNKLSSLPERIVEFKTLERLDVSGNDISSVPPIVGTMSLKSLVLSGNPIRSIRPAVLQRGTEALLQFLRERMPEASSGGSDGQAASSSAAVSSLDVMTSGDTRQLHAIHNLEASKALECSASKPITDELILAAAAASVTRVTFSRCQLAAVPERLSAMSRSLTHLILSHNKLAGTLTGVSALRSLISLNVSCNALSDFENLAALSSLRELNISGNRFARIPEQVYLLTSSLEILLAESNQITDINVEGLSQLTKLETLDLQGNSISYVPPTLGNMEQLRSLQLAGNTFRAPRAAILTQGTASLLAYLRDRIPA